MSSHLAEEETVLSGFGCLYIAEDGGEPDDLDFWGVKGTGDGH